MGLIPEDKVAEIRDRIDIVAVIGEHVPLRRAGVNHLGLCPFHAEKTPSFNVNASKQFFYCFGCQKSGDVFRFLMELEGRNFAEVARDLARRAGVEIPETGPQEGPQQRRQRLQSEDERAKLLRIHEIAASFFEAQLQRHPRALDYVKDRGIGDRTRTAFRLGYAPDSWDGLVQLLAQKGVPHELLEKSGLGVRRPEARLPPKGAPGGKSTHYDRFRDRIIFPLINAGGDVIAFGGRVLPPAPAPAGEGHPQADKDKERAKYINSPESPLYKKGDNLYGLHAAKESIRKGKQVVLVEGNFDVLALHEHGVDNAVAPMGTALTETQVRTLKRLLGSEGHVILMLDGDRAGRSATMKDIWLFSQANISDMARFTESEIDIRVAQLPDGEDPDTYVARDRPAFDRRLKTAKPAVDYVLDEAIKLAENDSVAEKAKVLMQVAPLLQAIRKPPVLDMYVDRLANSLAVDPRLIWRHVRGQVGPGGAGSPPHPRPLSPADAVERGDGRGGAQRGQAQAQGPAQKLDPAETALISLCGDHPRLLPLLQEEVLGYVADPALQEVLREAHALAASGEQVTAYHLIDLSPPEVRDAVASAALAGTFSMTEHPELALEQIGLKIRARYAQQELNELNQALTRAYKAGDQERIQELLGRMQELRLLKAGHGGPRAS